MNINLFENLLERYQDILDISPDQIQNFKSEHEDQSIKNDIELLYNMGFDKKIVNKVYILLSPDSIERAVEYNLSFITIMPLLKIFIKDGLL